MKPLKYRWKGIGTLKILFQKKSGGPEAVLRFDPVLPKKKPTKHTSVAKRSI